MKVNSIKEISSSQLNHWQRRSTRSNPTGAGAFVLFSVCLLKESYFSSLVAQSSSAVNSTREMFVEITSPLTDKSEQRRLHMRWKSLPLWKSISYSCMHTLWLDAVRSNGSKYISLHWFRNMYLFTYSASVYDIYMNSTN